MEITKDYKFDNEEINKVLFKKYYPFLNYEKIKHSSLLKQIIINDLFPCNGNTSTFEESQELYLDKPGPVG